MLQEFIYDDEGQNSQDNDGLIEARGSEPYEDQGRIESIILTLGNQKSSLKLKHSEKVNYNCSELSQQDSEPSEEGSDQDPRSENSEQDDSDRFDLLSEDETGILIELCYTFVTDLAISPRQYKRLSNENQETFLRFLGLRLNTTGYQVALNKLELERDFKMNALQLKVPQRLDPGTKQVYSSAYKSIKHFLPKRLKIRPGSISATELDRLLCQEYLGIENPDQQQLNGIFSYKNGISKKFVSAITEQGRKLDLIKEIIKTIDSGKATRMYAIKARWQLQRTFAAPGLPFMPIIKKQRGKGGKMYKTNAKAPVTLAEFKLHSKVALQVLKKRCKKMKFYKKLFGKLPDEQPRSKRGKSGHPKDPRSRSKKDVVISKDATEVEQPLKSKPRGRRQKNLQLDENASLPNKEAEKEKPPVKCPKFRAAKKATLTSKVKDAIKSKANKAKPKSKAPKEVGTAKKKRTESILWKQTYKRTRSHNSKKGGRLRSQSLYQAPAPVRSQSFH